MKKLLLSFLTFLVFFTSVVPNLLIVKAQAETSWYDQDFTPWYVKVYDQNTSPSNQIFGERYTAAQVQWIVYSLVAMPINWLGKDMEDFVLCAMKINGGGAVNPVECLQGISQFLVKSFSIITPLSYTNESSVLAMVLDTSRRPISGIGYTKNLVNKASLIPETYAQQTGFGYQSMQIITPYWRASRDIAFVFAILATIIFAFMIMFRIKISPQAVISIQSAIPKVVGGIILAAFSFAIAGLVIDLMYVISGVFATLMASSGIASSAARAYTSILGEFTIKNLSLGNAVGGPVTILVIMFLYLLTFAVSVIWNALTSILLSLSIITGTGFTIVGIALVVWLILLMVWYTFKIPWILFKTAINIYLSIIVAPLQIMLGIFVPAIGFGAWFKNLFANVLVFPLTGLLIYLAYDFLMFSFTAGTLTGINGFQEFFQTIINVFGIKAGLGATVAGASISAQTGLWAPPWLGADVTGFMFLMMSFGIIVMIPKATEILKAIIMGEKFAFGSAIGEAAAPLTGISRYAGGVFQEGLGRYAGAPALDWLMERQAYQRFVQGSRVGREVNKFVQGTYDQLDRRRGG